MPATVLNELVVFNLLFKKSTMTLVIFKWKEFEWTYQKKSRKL